MRLYASTSDLGYHAAVLTAEEYLRKMQDPRWYGEQDENGVDLSLIRDNLRRSPLERLRRGDQATTDVLRLRRLTQNHEPPRK